MKRFIVIWSLGVALILVIFFLSIRNLNTIEPQPLPSPTEQTITVTPPAEVNIKSSKPVDIKIKVESPAMPGAVVGIEINYENVLNGVNKVRYDLGLSILKRSASLDAIAEARLADMQKYNYFAHTNPTTGKKFQYWYDQPGDLLWSYTGENLARNFSTVQETIDAWIKSPTHYAEMTKKEFTHTGIAISGSLVVQEFGTHVEQ